MIFSYVMIKYAYYYQAFNSIELFPHQSLQKNINKLFFLYLEWVIGTWQWSCVALA